jgi:hypothetical protein
MSRSDNGAGIAELIEETANQLDSGHFPLAIMNNREIYDWLLDEVGYREPRPHQYEFTVEQIYPAPVPVPRLDLIFMAIDQAEAEKDRRM